MIEQIRHLQSRTPFETFALELSTGRIIQISDEHQIATSTVNEWIGVLSPIGVFEVVRASDVVSVSVGTHPIVKADRDAQLGAIKELLKGVMK